MDNLQIIVDSAIMLGIYVAALAAGLLISAATVVGGLSLTWLISTTIKLIG